MPLPILQTKLHRPSLAPNLVCRKALHDQLEAGRHLPLTLVSGPAGYGKSTLIAQWLEERGHLAAWISLEESDSDLRVFLAYVLAAIRTLFPKAADETKAFLTETDLPSPAVLADFLINDLDAIAQPFILALDDYYLIHGTAVHDLLARILKHPPQSMHIVIMTRYNPPLPIASLRGNGRLAEVKMNALKFTLPESTTYLEKTLDPTVALNTVEKLHRRTEGWAVGLRLAVLAMQHCSDVNAFIDDFEGRSHHIEDYLVSEILSQQPTVLRDWLIQTAILDRFNASLCEAVCKTSEVLADEQMNGAEFIRTLRSKGLFVIRLDNHHKWYRYHHLFKELLLRQLNNQMRAGEIKALHRQAVEWLEAHDLIEEALCHTFALDDPQVSGQLILKNRNQFTQREQWHRLNRLLSLLPPQIIDNNPDLLILKAWCNNARGRIAEIFKILDRIEPLIADILSDNDQERIKGEVDALRGYQHIIDGNGQSALKLTEQALNRLPANFSSERISATILMAVSLQMTGDLNGAHRIIYNALEKEQCANSSCHGRLLMSLCFIHWLSGNLKELGQTGRIMLTAGMDNDLPETKAYARYFLGISLYHNNQLTEAQEHLACVVSERPIPSMATYIRGAQALSLTYQAQGHYQKAIDLTENVVERLLKTANTYYLPTMQAFQAELAFRQGRLKEAIQWVEGFEVGIPAESYGFFLPELTAVKVRLHQATPGALRQVEALLGDFLPFFESANNTRILLEVLALQALLHIAKGEEPAALSFLKRAIELAQPGGFIRVFVDLGPDVVSRIHRLQLDDEGLHYAGRLIAAFKEDASGKFDRQPSLQAWNSVSDQPLQDPLTQREQEVLAFFAQRLSNKEIADNLFLSIGTVKAHASNIYQKLGVRSRKEAVAKASGIGLFRPKENNAHQK